MNENKPKKMNETLGLEENEFETLGKHSKHTLIDAENMSEYIINFAKIHELQNNERILIATGYLIGREISQNQQISLLENAVMKKLGGEHK